MKLEITERDIFKAIEKLYYLEEGTVKSIKHIEGVRYEIEVKE